MLRKAIASIALVLVAQGAAWAQFDSLLHNPAQPVVTEGFLALHDDGNSFKAFSAFGRRWHPVAPTGAYLVGSGDWTALFGTAGPLVGYSARRDEVANAPCNPGDVVLALVDDDVALIIATNTGTGYLDAHAYSAQTNVWVTQPLTVTALAAGDVAISRFVIGVVDGHNMYGFSARTGAWTFEPVSAVVNLQADGNVILANVYNLGGIHVGDAFSGVTGTWAMSPQVTGNPIPFRLKHNVAFVLADAGGGNFNSCGYSAYNASWVVGGLHGVGGPWNAQLGHNTIVVDDVAAVPTLEALGARPGLAWAGLGGGSGLGGIRADMIWASSLAGNTVHAFSGLSNGGWVNQAIIGPVATTSVSGHVLQVIDSGNVIHSFAPAYAAWAAPKLGAGATLNTSGAVAMTDTGGVCDGYATRSNLWTAGPAFAAPLIVPGGSLIAIQETAAGPTAGDTFVWDERRDMFVGPFTVGGVAALHAGRNLALFEGAATIAAYGLQRSAFETALDASLGIVPTMPLAAAPTTEENVATFIDGGGRVWAYGSTNDLHTWYAWPNGTEYQKWSGSLWFSTESSLNERIFYLWDLNRLAAGVWLGPIFTGLLWLPTITPILPPMGPMGPGPAHHDSQPLPGGGGSLQIWTQAARFLVGPSVKLSMAPEPAWIF